MKLGPVEIAHPFLLAPMAGITNSPFRRLMREYGSSVVISELVSANGIEYASHRTLELLKFVEAERPVGLQIFGEDEANLVNACRVVERMGANFVDLNLGCPVPKVVKKGAGSAMCRNPAGLGKILDAMVKSVKIPVTIKIRTGWDSTLRNAAEVVKVAADAGVAWVAIHGRTRAQGYSGEADWDFIGDIKAKSPLPIIGNGDVGTAEQAVARYKTYGVDAVMIGRGALRNPFIFEQSSALLEGRPVSPVNADRIIELLQKQRGYLTEVFEGRSVLLHARKFLAWYSSGYPGSGEFRKNVFHIPDEPALWAEAERFFRESISKRDFGFLNEPFLMGGHG
ncbi:MAG: tRNA dihydrouridine synthase DusB [Proteobacteria bacterium]|nr:tRNA dihydrouridine synthase DusB [Pseudomonadota bacterium]